MPAHSLLPGPDELRKMVDAGLTQQQIVDEVERTTGVRVTRAAVSAKLVRAGLAPGRRKVYQDMIPWTVKVKHNKHYALRMLRAEARKRRGDDIPIAEERKLRAWKELLANNDAVVHYDPDTEEGFFYVDPRPEDRAYAKGNQPLVRITDDMMTTV